MEEGGFERIEAFLSQGAGEQHFEADGRVVGNHATGSREAQQAHQVGFELFGGDEGVRRRFLEHAERVGLLEHGAGVTLPEFRVGVRIAQHQILRNEILIDHAAAHMLQRPGVFTRELLGDARAHVGHVLP